jgi:hypothetical protein
MNRRYFLLAAAICAGCARGRGNGAPARSAVVRAPAIGQSWRYAKRDRITGSMLDTETYQVATIGDSIELTAKSEAQKGAARSHLNPLALVAPVHRDQPERTLPSEVQKTWGMVLIDPHWEEPQIFQEPMPLWPQILEPGWSTRVHTTYLTADITDPLPWQLTMHAHEWESVAVPAGRFNVLRFTNLIDFSSSDRFRRSSRRTETVWFAPQIGRWVARESSGTYYRGESVDDQPLLEASYRWELLNWS